MRKALVCLLAVMLMLGVGAAIAEENLPVEEYAKYEEYGEVVMALTVDGKAYIRANGFYGYHMEENPYVTVDVIIGEGGLVEYVSYVDSKAQTPGFPDMLTEDFYQSFTGTDSSSVLAVDAVSGATVTSQAVRYGVQTALYYADKAYGIAADTAGAEIGELSEVWPGEYVPITTEYVVDAKVYGTVLFAAEDEKTVALKVQSSKKLNYKKSSDTGWPNAEPDQYVMIIAIDKETSKVVASKVVVDGTKRTEYFVVPEEKLESYTKVAIAEETVFDEFTDGLVYGIEGVEFEKDGMGMQVITGTSVIFTGASVDGTFSSQLVRRCFQTAARFYCNYK